MAPPGLPQACSNPPGSFNRWPHARRRMRCICAVYRRADVSLPPRRRAQADADAAPRLPPPPAVGDPARLLSGPSVTDGVGEGVGGGAGRVILSGVTGVDPIWGGVGRMSLFARVRPRAHSGARAARARLHGRRRGLAEGVGKARPGLYYGWACVWSGLCMVQPRALWPGLSMIR